MLLKIALSIIIIGLCFIIHKFIIKPYLAIRYYKNLGFKMTFFFPLFGFARLIRKSIEKHNDFSYFHKHLLHDYIGSKGIVTNIMDKPCLILADTAYKKDFFVNKLQYYEKHYFVRNSLENDSYSNENLILAEGDSWKRIKKIVAKTFHYDFIISCIPIIISTIDKVFNNIKNLNNVNIMDEFQTITGSVILRSMFGDDFVEMKYNGIPAPVVLSSIIAKTAGRRFNYFNIILGRKISKYLSPGYRKELKDQQDFTENFLMKYIKEKYDEFKIKMKENQNFEEKYLIDSMFRLVFKGEENFTLEEVLTNLNTLFIAGTDTSGHLLAHLIYMLWKNPIKYQKLMKELEMNTLAIDKVDYETIKNLEYLNGIIKEGLRMVSPANDIFLRSAIKDNMLYDLPIKKGTALFLGLSINFNDPSIYRKPFEFIPERWIKGDELFDNAEDKDPFCYLPFSAGARNCIGQHMAIIEAKIILSKFLTKFEFEIKNKEPIVWVPKLVAEPKDPLIVKLTKRLVTQI